MSGLDLFALFVLIILVAAAVVLWVTLGIMPGRIAVERDHPQAEAIRTCGWLGALTHGVLSPLAFIWAYMRPGVPRADAAGFEGLPEPASGPEHDEESRA